MAGNSPAAGGQSGLDPVRPGPAGLAGALHQHLAGRLIDATAERNWVRFRTGPAVIFSARTQCGLYGGSLLWSAT
jgi:hypothetical protein